MRNISQDFARKRNRGTPYTCGENPGWGDDTAATKVGYSSQKVPQGHLEFGKKI